MRISKLDLYGFKSFPDRTAFQFGSGVSCVVGPNGCGKSNVVDALRWCIGEQSARKLRGGEMLDVIFAGSSERAPVGFAEVMLTLTADSGEPFPGEFAHLDAIQVGRRLHRNGTSEYVINQVKCRRRDIVELFMDTGIGNNLYSFIEQGQVDKMVHASPMDRRGIIDEAAGIARYAARRAEAQARLEATAGQLDRAADVADEMGRRLRVLERQVLKAAKFRRLRALIRQEEILLSVVKYAELSADRRALRQQLIDSNGEMAALRREVDRRQGDLVARREEIGVVDAAANSWRDEVAEHDARRRELEGAKAFQEKRVLEFDGQRERALADAATAAAAEVEEIRIGVEAQEQGAELADARDGARTELERASVAATAAHEAKIAAREALREHEGAHELAATELATWQLSLERDESRLAELPSLERSLRLALDSAREHFHRQTGRRESVRRDYAEAEARLAALTLVLDEAQAGVSDADRHLREAHEQARTMESDLERYRADLEDEVEALVADARAARDAAEADRVAGRAARGAALEAARRRGVQTVEDHFAEEVATAQSAEEARVDRAAAAQSAARSAAVAELAASLAADVAVFEGAGEQMMAEASALEGAIAARAASERALREEVARLEGVVAAHAAWQAADTDRATASAIVNEVVGDGRSLAERLHLSEADIAALTPVLGERLLLPVVVEAEIEALSSALEERVASVLWLPEDDPLGALQERIRVFESLSEAMAHHASTGGAAAVSGTGEHIGTDGVLRLGRPSQAVSSQLTREREAKAAADRLEEIAPALEEVVLRQGAENAALARVREQLDANRRQIREVELGARQEETARLDELRAAASAGELVAVADYRRARQDRFAARSDALADLRAGWDGEIHPCPPVVDAVLRDYSSTRAALDEAQEVRVAAVDAAEAAVRAGRLGARKAIHDRIAAAQIALEEVRELHYRATESQAAAVETRVKVERDQNDVALDLARTSLELESLETGIGESSGRVETLEVDCEDLVRERAELEAALPGRRARIARVRAGEEERRAALEKLRAADDLASAGELRAAEAVAQCEVVLAGLAERLSANAKTLEDSVARREAAASRAVRGAEHVTALEATLAEAGELAAAAAEEIAAQGGVRDEAWDRLQRERDRLAALRAGLRESEEALRQLSVRRESLSVQNVELEQRSQQVKVEVEVLRRRIDDRYQVSLAGFMDRIGAGSITLMPDPAVREGFEVAGHTVAAVEPVLLNRKRLADEGVIRQAVADIEGHRAALAALGEVNLGALEEYEDLARRHRELDEQRTDLEASVSSIRSAIAKMNRTCRQRFRDAFDKVNDNFQEAYPRLVGGGAARLSLTDEDDLLETGVEIFVQPPGKRLQNLTLLSGGEKAMTAIALLIALFRVKPSPLCVLDEVDAPLDEANGARFNEMLREMAALSQFVVITHNRKTMEVADTLYGVTMVKPGVSRLVSVKLSSTG